MQEILKIAAVCQVLQLLGDPVQALALQGAVRDPTQGPNSGQV